MDELNQALVDQLQARAHEGASVSAMLRELSHKLERTEPHKLTLIKYLRRAFGLSLQEVSPVGGWAADGKGDLSDSQLDEFLNPAISNYRAKDTVAGIGKNMGMPR